MNDQIDRIGKSWVQHGKFNDRIYLMKLHADDFPDILKKLDLLAKKGAYAKIFAKLPSWAAPRFKAAGYIQEASIPEFYRDPPEDAFFMSKFLDADRVHFLPDKALSGLSDTLRSHKKRTGIPRLNKKYRLVKLGREDIPQITRVYKAVFKTYPFPIHDDDYIRTVMDDHTEFFGISRKEQIVAVSSAEMDLECKNAEMTDFATLPEYRGNKFSVILLDHMENQVRSRGIRTVYTIARLHSKPMNLAFLGMGYRYGGTLINNTNIAGRIESMNILYKYL